MSSKVVVFVEGWQGAFCPQKMEKVALSGSITLWCRGPCPVLASQPREGDSKNL